MKRALVCWAHSCLLLACAEGFSAPIGGAGGESSPGGGAQAGAGEGGAGGQGGEGAQAPGGGGAGGGETCASDPCKLVAPQCGCAEGEQCTIVGGGDIGCDDDGTAALGAACNASNDCAAGGLCLGNLTSGYCAQFCDQDLECDQGICVVQLGDGAGGTIPGVQLCSSTCDPATAAGCPAGLGCALGQESTGPMRYFFMCFGAGNLGNGQACTGTADCAPGFGCYNNGTNDACYKNCNVTTQNCTGIQTCLALNDQNGMPVVVDGYPLGVCQ